MPHLCVRLTSETISSGSKLSLTGHHATGYFLCTQMTLLDQLLFMHRRFLFVVMPNLKISQHAKGNMLWVFDTGERIVAHVPFVKILVSVIVFSTIPACCSVILSRVH